MKTWAVLEQLGREGGREGGKEGGRAGKKSEIKV